jgi:hypothetical protein
MLMQVAPLLLLQTIHTRVLVTRKGSYGIVGGGRAMLLTPWAPGMYMKDYYKG